MILGSGSSSYQPSVVRAEPRFNLWAFNRVLLPKRLNDTDSTIKRFMVSDRSFHLFLNQKKEP